MKSKNKIFTGSFLFLCILLVVANSCKKNEENNNKAPIQPSLPTPSHNANNISTSPTLIWDSSDPDGDPVTYDVYFDTSTTPATKLSSNQTETSYKLATLDFSKDYYWKIVAKDDKNNTTDSPVWKFTTQNRPESETGTVTDYEGNVYKTVKISDQWWMAENLKSTKYNDGTSIPLIKKLSEWIALSTPGYCWQINDTAFGNIYGALYNFYAISTGKLAPAGWHVPTDDEWTTLVTYLGGEDIAGGKLKEADISHWSSPNVGATNQSGFSALPGGRRNWEDFRYLGSAGIWWSASEYLNTNSWCYMMSFSHEGVGRFFTDKYIGNSVRCVKD
jgi:uncharacterized protein (TIGR02145 family)